MTILSGGTFEEIRMFNENYFRVVLPDGNSTWVVVTHLSVKYAEMLEEKYHEKGGTSILCKRPKNQK